MSVYPQKQWFYFLGLCLAGGFCGCKKAEPQKDNVLKPVQTDIASKGLNENLPTGIENPVVKTEAAQASPGSPDKPGADTKAAGVKHTECAAASSDQKAAKPPAQKAAHTDHAPRETAPVAQAAVPPAPSATPSVQAEKAETKAATKTVVPQSANVRAEVPAGLQRLLDGDTRMQPWVNRVMAVAEQCYAKERASNPLAKGVIAINVTMHQNDRPDAAIGSLPALLAGMVPCATGKLMGSRMPFFTGDEGAKYTVRLHFTR
jgi:hypothetical protein